MNGCFNYLATTTRKDTCGQSGLYCSHQKHTEFSETDAFCNQVIEFCPTGVLMIAEFLTKSKSTVEMFSKRLFGEYYVCIQATRESV